MANFPGELTFCDLKLLFFFFVHGVLVVGQKNHLIAKMRYLIKTP